LTADILKIANSAAYGFSQNINSIKQAVSLFGMNAIRNFALKSLINKNFNINLFAYEIDTEEFSNLSTSQSNLITKWFKKDKDIIDNLTTSAFLCEIGKILISQFMIQNQLIEKYWDTVEELDNFDEAEIALIGVDTTEVSSTILSHWKFNQDIVDTIYHSLEPSEAEDEKIKKQAQILKVVRETIYINGDIDNDSIKLGSKLVQEYNLDLNSYINACKELKRELNN
jgi:HD-like signal output (HDOD) protein